MPVTAVLPSIFAGDLITDANAQNLTAMKAGLHTGLKKFSIQTYWREILAVLMLLLTIFFFRAERKEWQHIIPQIRSANPFYLFLGFSVTALYIFFQAGIYRKCFAAVGKTLFWHHALTLFLKRNFIGVFLPAGGVSALAYSPSQIRRAGFTQTEIHQASGLFGYAGLLTVFLAGLPVISFTMIESSQLRQAWIGLLIILAVLALLFAVVRSLRAKGKLYLWLVKKFPSVEPLLQELFAANVNRRQFGAAVLFSLGVEVTGMIHVFLAMLALGLPASFGAAASVYIIAVIMMVISPFLRGLGAVEFSMVFVLQQFGYQPGAALAITILFRVFEFWAPLTAGLLAFAWKGRSIFLRVAPALLTFLLGIVNIISVVTPPLNERMHLLRGFLPLTAIHASNMLVLFVGLSLLVTAAFLFQGLRNAWIIALCLSVFSFVGHLTKALDYEEATIAALTVVVLSLTVREYRIRSSNKWMQTGIITALLSMGAVLIFGFISFYFIDKRHFGIDFTWLQSLIHTGKIFLLVEDSSLQPLTRFGHEFIVLIRSLGFITWGFLLFALIKPHIRTQTMPEAYREKARFLLKQFGSSPVDYFKLCNDKLFFFSDLHEGFIAYRIARGFAVVLEEPVCAAESKTDIITEFDRHCRKMGLKTAFYRVDENSMPWFNALRKQKMRIGQEAILDTSQFTLEGRDKKSLRNGLNSLKNKGYTAVIHKAPQEDDFLMKLKTVSDEWLAAYQKEEMIFSQGMFDARELKKQDIITLEPVSGAIVAFLNIIPDYAEDEITYDLIRKSADAPGAAMDALILKLVEYTKEQGKQYINLGLVPLAGLTESDNAAEQIIRMIAARVKRLQHYKGLREFKEKYATIWENKYLVYDQDFDLIRFPNALKQVMKP